MKIIVCGAGEVGSNIDMAELRFKHLKKMVLEKSKDMGLDVKQ